MSESYKCPRCTMTYHVVDDYPTVGERLRCADCRMPFHSTNTAGLARVCMLRDELLEYV